MAVNYNARVVSDGLLACWDAGSNLSLSNINRNIISFPEDLTNAVWGKFASGTGTVPTVTANFATAPDGTSTADLVTFASGGNGNSQLDNPGVLGNLAIGTIRTFSVWMRTLTDSTIITMFNGDNIQNVTVTSSWERFTYTNTITSGVAFGTRLAKRESWGSGGTASVLIWGAQWEVGSTASTYYPVSSSGPSTTWFDISGRRNDCSLVSGITLTESNNIKSLYFSGAQRSRIPTDTFNTFYSGKTMFVVAKIDSNFGSSGTFRGFLGGGGGTRNFNFYLNRNGSLYRFHFSQGVNYSFLGGVSSDLTGLALDQWFIGAVTQTSAGLVTYYFNGVPVGTHTTALQQFVPHTELDYLGGNDTNWFGDIAFCAAYSKALTDSEIIQMYNALRGRYGI